MILYYVRHGDPVYEPDSLTPLGQRQAEAVAKRFAVYGLDKIYASTSNRAILTAKPTCEVLKLEAELLDFANEGHAWRELTVDLDEGRRTWLFHHKKKCTGNNLFIFFCEIAEDVFVEIFLLIILHLH